MGETFSGLVTDGPLLVAAAVAALVGLISFASPCVLPLVPGYLSYVAGLVGTGPAAPEAPDEPAGGGGTATAVRTRPKPPRVDQLPPWKVLLHDDPINEIGYVVETIVELVKLNPLQALLQTLEADKTGVALLLCTHRERAELLAEQFATKKLTVTIEPSR